MKTVEDYLDWIFETRKILNTEKTKELVKQASIRDQAYYSLTSEIPLYPTDDNQMLLVDFDESNALKLMGDFGFNIVGVRKDNYSPWNFNNDKLFNRYTLEHSHNVFTALVCYDPTIAYFGSLEKSMITTPVGLNVPSPEIELLGSRLFPKDQERFIAKIPMFTYITLHPNGRAERKDQEDIVIEFLNSSIKRGINLFYGEFKSKKGVLHKI